ncbi:hypothetical protein QYF36_013860 [Acer negundo]|nr:hypothetical protein QYF36_013860 [Acer negundo]
MGSARSKGVVASEASATQAKSFGHALLAAHPRGNDTQCYLGQGDAILPCEERSFSSTSASSSSSSSSCSSSSSSSSSSSDLLPLLQIFFFYFCFFFFFFFFVFFLFFRSL